jgi:hypothetical protein
MLQHTLHMKLALCGGDFFANLSKAAVAACAEADKEICAELRKMEDDSGSTGVFVVIDGRKKEFAVGNVGDSRCVLSRGGTAIELSKDHRVAREDEKKRVLDNGCRIRDKRVNGVRVGVGGGGGGAGAIEMAKRTEKARSFGTFYARFVPRRLLALSVTVFALAFLATH